MNPFEYGKSCLGKSFPTKVFITMINLTQDSHTKSESAILKPKRPHDGQDHFFAPLLLDYL